MIEPNKCHNLTEIRKEIDLIDNNIVDLIAKRSFYVKEAAKYKKDEESVKDSIRVETIINSKKLLAEKKGVSTELIEEIFRTMINYFINEEMKEWKAQ